MLPKNTYEMTSPLASPSATREALDIHGLSPKYSYGQNFLINDAIIRKIVDLAQICEGDEIIEVGPGMGVLTIAMLLRGAHVTAIEKDPDMVKVLKSNVERFCPKMADNLTILNTDALNLQDEYFEQFNKHTELKLVANLPYNVAAPIVITYFQSFPNLCEATVMVQREIAERMMAVPGTKNYGAYTVKLSMYASFAGKFKVSAHNFMPKPRVESMVIKLVRNGKDYPGQPFSTTKKTDIAALACLVADAAFAHRRKTINNSVKQHFLSSAGEPAMDDFASIIYPEGADNLPDLSDKKQKATFWTKAVLKAIENSGIESSVRAEVLTSQDFEKIAREIWLQVAG